MARIAWQVDPTVPGSNTFGRFGMAQFSPPVTRRLAINATEGDEYFIDENGARFKGVGQNLAYEAMFPDTDAKALREAAQLARRFRFVRVMDNDANPEFNKSGDNSTGWWSIDPVAGAWPGWSNGSGTVWPIDANALLYFRRMTRRCREAKLRAEWALNHNVVLRGMGVPESGGAVSATNPFPHRGLLWTATNLAALKTYLTMWCRLSCDYTEPSTGTPYVSGLTNGTDPFWFKITLQNEYSASRGWDSGNAAGTDGYDRVIVDGNTVAEGEIDSDWYDFCINTYGQAPYGVTPGDGYTGFPLRAVATTGTHKLFSDANYSATMRLRWGAFLLNRQRYLCDQITALLAVEAPGMSVGISTETYSQPQASDGATSQDTHYYLNGGSVSRVNKLTVAAGGISSAVISGGNLLTVTFATAPGGTGSGNRIGSGNFVKMIGLTGGPGGSPNIVHGPITNVSPTAFTVPFTGSNGGYVCTSASADISADLGFSGGECVISNSNLGLYLYNLAGRHVAGKVMTIGEAAVKGIATRETTHYVTLGLLTQVCGWMGYGDWSWSAGGTSFYGRSTIAGDEDAINMGARDLAHLLAGLIMKHDSVVGGTGGVVVSNVTDDYYLSKAVTSTSIGNASYYPELATTPADFRRVLFNKAHKRWRMKRHATINDIDTVGAAAGPLGNVGVDNPLTCGANDEVRWFKTAGPVTNGDGTSDNERIEFTGTSKFSGVTGRVLNGDYGLVNISGLTSVGTECTIAWHTFLGGDLGYDLTLLFVLGYSLNGDFNFLDALKRYYLEYGSGTPQVWVPECTITLNIAGRPQQLITRVDANGTEAGVPGDYTQNSTSIIFSSGNQALYALEPAASADPLARRSARFSPQALRQRSRMALRR